MPARVLVVDDEENVRRSVRLLLSDLEGVEVAEAAGGDHALRALVAGGVDLVVTDLRLRGLDGRELLRRCRALRPEVPVILVTADGATDETAGAIRDGAFDTLRRPFRERELKLVVERALRMGEVLRENRRLREELDDRRDLARIAGTSPAIAEARRLAREAAQTDATVLLLGAPGTGKATFARAIHAASPRRAEPFVTMSVGATAAPDVDAELFGDTPGTGPERRPGAFRAAGSGTLFVREVDALSPASQAKLLRALDEGRARVLFASSRDLAAMVEAKAFREDLWCRISTYPIRLPPLRDRPEDVLPIAGAALDALGRRLGKRFAGFDDGARRHLESHPWEGNARELRNAIERAAIAAAGPWISASDLTPAPAAGADAVVLLPEAGADLAEIERSLITQAMKRTHGNVSAAARLLGLTRAQLRYRLAKRRDRADR